MFSTKVVHVFRKTRTRFYRIIRQKTRTKEVNDLFDAVLSLKDREECYLFFGDVCTINELLIHNEGTHSLH